MILLVTIVIPKKNHEWNILSAKSWWIRIGRGYEVQHSGVFFVDFQWAGSKSQGRKVNYRREVSEMGNGKRDMNIGVSVCDSRTLAVRFCRTTGVYSGLFKQWTCLFCFALPLCLSSPFRAAEVTTSSQLCVLAVKEQRWKGNGGWKERRGWKRAKESAEWWLERGTTNITGGRAAGESRRVISQDFVIETLFEVEPSKEHDG